MRAWKFFAVCLSAALFAAPAAARFGYCMAAIPGKDHQEIPGHYNTTYPSYVSAIIDFGESSERVAEQFAKQFSAAVGTAHATCYNHFEDASGATYYRGESLKKGLGQHVESAWTGGRPAAANGRIEKKPDTRVGGIYITGGKPTSAGRASPNSGSAAPKYVEVAGTDGTIARLSPEVAARNKAAADEYRRKMDEHANATANHERKLALHQQSIASAAAEKREHARRLAANAAEVATHQAALLEHRKMAAKPAGVNAVYRGFNGPTCEIARRSALFGSGTSKGTQFAEVTQDLSGMPRTCIVQGWWWNTSRTGSSRQ